MTLLLLIVLVGLLLVVAKLAPEPVEKVIYIGEHLITYTTDELAQAAFRIPFDGDQGTTIQGIFVHFNYASGKVEEWMQIGGVWKPSGFEVEIIDKLTEETS